ncbi:MAG: hypothetical protein UX94_C0011G0013 [Parcubacteria group bacterium GW2011_GWA2_47_21]|nr:MAG: hypothetical protein UX94_C0011G0013 [Parcubacteria group bacterium GW2011_GWA2_47_21]
MIIKPVKTRIFLEGENLLNFILEHIKKIPEKSVLAVTSKIAALSEGRTALVKDEKEKERLIRAESQFAMRTKYVWLTIRDNLVMASAGIDESNGNGKLILLPQNSFALAEKIRKTLMKKFLLKNFAVIITDSRLIPLRHGTVGVTIGYAGLRGLKSYKGKPDIFGRTFRHQRVDAVDSLATAAVLTMGEGNEQIPLALIEKVPVEFVEKTDKRELEIDVQNDLYLPLFEKIKKVKIRKG